MHAATISGGHHACTHDARLSVRAAPAARATDGIEPASTAAAFRGVGTRIAYPLAHPRRRTHRSRRTAPAGRGAQRVRPTRGHAAIGVDWAKDDVVGRAQLHEV